MNMHAEMELPFPAMQKGFPQAGMQYVPACGNPFCVLLYPFPFPVFSTLKKAKHPLTLDR
jgi:hypothetical protein